MLSLTSSVLQTEQVVTSALVSAGVCPVAEIVPVAVTSLHTVQRVSVEPSAVQVASTVVVGVPSVWPVAGIVDVVIVSPQVEHIVSM